MFAMASILDTLLAHVDACTTSQIEDAARLSGVPYHTIAKIKRRETSNPRIETVQKLLTYFQRPRNKRPTKQHAEA